MAYNNTAQWQDPNNPPSPGDPYWDEWIAANPDYRGQGYNGPAAPAPTQTVQSTPFAPTSYNYQQALSKIQSSLGRSLSGQDIQTAFQRFGGDQNSTFTDASIDPVIQYFHDNGNVRPTDQPTIWNPDGEGHQTWNPDGGNGQPTTWNPDANNTDQFGNRIPQYRSNPNAPPAFGGQYGPNGFYQEPTWGGGAAPNANPLAQWHMPTLAELQASPGYQARLDAGNLANDRSAAAQGSVLNGGTIKARERYAQDFASNEYSNLVNQTQGGTQLNNAAAQGDFSNAYQSYLGNYGQFSDAANRNLGARQQNVSEANNAFNQGQIGYQNRYTQYLDNNNRTLQDYLTNQSTKRNSELDYWSRLNDLNNTGANSANNSYRFQAFQ